jgi:hypothetical protein
MSVTYSSSAMASGESAAYDGFIDALEGIATIVLDDEPIGRQTRSVGVDFGDRGPERDKLCVALNWARMPSRKSLLPDGGYQFASIAVIV